MTKGLYAGSFDPFTEGHLYLVEEAAQLFDELHVVMFNNPNKKRNFDAIKMVQAIDKVLKRKGITNCVVSYQEGLLAKYCKDNDIRFNFRGLRDGGDFNYEANLAFANRVIYPDLHTIYAQSIPENMGLSSTLVRELYKYGEDITKLVPKEVLDIM